MEERKNKTKNSDGLRFREVAHVPLNLLQTAVILELKLEY